jgi:hypothetical protein
VTNSGFLFLLYVIVGNPFVQFFRSTSLRVKTHAAISLYPPKVIVFSGGDNKIETPYDIWRYDVKMTLMYPSYAN